MPPDPSRFKYITPEQFQAWVAQQTRLGIPERCEDPVTLAMVAQMVVDTLRGPARASQANDLAEAA
jgi:hypothetical protein